MAGSRYKRQRTWVEGLYWILKVGLGIVATFTTYDGVREILTSSSGEPDVTIQAALLFAIAMLVLGILYTLAILTSQAPLWKKGLALGLYALLSLISIGFSFGFYWKKLEAGASLTPSITAALSNVSVQLNEAKAGLEHATEAITKAADHSTRKAEEEKASGKTCGDESIVGPGPRMRLRQADADLLAKSRGLIDRKVIEITRRIDGLDFEQSKALIIAKIHSDATDADMVVRQKRDDLRRIADEINKLKTHPDIQETISSLTARSEKHDFVDGIIAFNCFDPVLRTNLVGAIAALKDLPQLTIQEFKIALGAEATRDAFLRLATWFGQGILSWGTSVFGVNVNSQDSESLTRRDILPLLIAVFVNAFLLFLALTRPRDPFEEFRRRMRQLSGREQSPFRRFFNMLNAGNVEQAWLRLSRRNVRIGSSQYFVLPSDEDDDEVQLMKMFFNALLDDGQVSRTMPLGKLLIKFKLFGFNLRSWQSTRLDIYKMRRGGYAELMFASLMDVELQPARSGSAAGHQGGWIAKIGHWLSPGDGERHAEHQRQTASPHWKASRDGQATRDMPTLRHTQFGSHPVVRGINPDLESNDPYFLSSRGRGDFQNEIPQHRMPEGLSPTSNAMGKKDKLDALLEESLIGY